MKGNNDDRNAKLIAKSIKGFGFLCFIGINAFLMYSYLTAFEAGTRRGQIYHKKKDEQLKKQEPQPKAYVPAELQPQYIEKQVRKYKTMIVQKDQSKQMKP